MIILYREILARYCIQLFFLIAPKQMRQVYARHIYIASAVYAEILKKECVK